MGKDYEIEFYPRPYTVKRKTKVDVWTSPESLETRLPRTKYR